MLRFKNEFGEENLIFAFVHQESAHDFRLLDVSTLWVRKITEGWSRCDSRTGEVIVQQSDRSLSYRLSDIPESRQCGQKSSVESIMDKHTCQT